MFREFKNILISRKEIIIVTNENDGCNEYLYSIAGEFKFDREKPEVHLTKDEFESITVDGYWITIRENYQNSPTEQFKIYCPPEMKAIIRKNMVHDKTFDLSYCKQLRFKFNKEHISIYKMPSFVECEKRYAPVDIQELIVKTQEYSEGIYNTPKLILSCPTISKPIEYAIFKNDSFITGGTF